MSQPQLRLRMDRSRYFATEHGERAPSDPFHRVHAWQDGLPFDGEGLLVEEGIKDDAEKQALVERRKGHVAAAKLKQAQEVKPTLEDRIPESTDVNLTAWLRGEVRYQPHVVFAAAASPERYSKRCTKIPDLVDFLVNDPKGPKLVHISQVSPKLLPRSEEDD